MDFYKILNVARTATVPEIKKAYRKLALRFHPDIHLNSADDERNKAEESLKRINVAYETLSDQRKKTSYDRSIGNYDRYRFYQSRNPETYARNAPTGPVAKEHFDVDAWNAWHYGDNAIVTDAIQQKKNSSNAKEGNKHQEYFRRQRERRAATAAAAAESGTRIQPYDPFAPGEPAAEAVAEALAAAAAAAAAAREKATSSSTANKEKESSNTGERVVREEENASAQGFSCSNGPTRGENLHQAMGGGWPRDSRTQPRRADREVYRGAEYYDSRDIRSGGVRGGRVYSAANPAAASAASVMSASAQNLQRRRQERLRIHQQRASDRRVAVGEQQKQNQNQQTNSSCVVS